MEHLSFGELAVSELMAGRVLYMTRGQLFCFTKIQSAAVDSNVVVLECGRMVKVGQMENEALSTDSKRTFRIPLTIVVRHHSTEKIFYFSFEPWNNQGEYRAAIASLAYKELVRSIFLKR